MSYMNLDLPKSMQVDLNHVLSVLKKYNAAKIILYGSVARGDYKDSSDLDICVEGLDSQYFFKALGECIMECKHSVSVTDFDTTYGYFRERILREGKVIYGLPFEVKLPTEDTQKALDELVSEKGRKFKTTDELFQDLDN